MQNEIIYSRQNDRVKNLVKLRQAHYRKRLGRFIIEGVKEIKEALEAKMVFDDIYFCQKYLIDASLLDRARASSIPLQEVTKSVFEKITYRDTPDGILGVAHTWETDLEAIKLSKNPLLLVAEGIEKPGNLGSLMRSAESAGADALILCQSKVDLFNPNVVHASRGALFTLPIAMTNSEMLRNFLEKHGIATYVMTPHTQLLYWEADLAGPSAILIGSEKDGLSDYWMKGEGVKLLKIPLQGQADSLNAGISGALVLYEALRQRQK